jgi:hypothetical protein
MSLIPLAFESYVHKHHVFLHPPVQKIKKLPNFYLLQPPLPKKKKERMDHPPLLLDMGLLIE